MIDTRDCRAAVALSSSLQRDDASLTVMTEADSFRQKDTLHACSTWKNAFVAIRDMMKLLKHSDDVHRQPVALVRRRTTTRKASGVPCSNFGSMKTTTAVVRGEKHMLFKNIVPTMNLFNGSIGTVIDIVYDDNEGPVDRNAQPLFVVVDFPELEWGTRTPYDPANVTHFPVAVMNEPCDNNCCQHSSIPLIPAKALSIDKAQGMTCGFLRGFERILLDFGSITGRISRCPGLAYSALTRATTLRRFAIVDPMPLEYWLGVGKGEPYDRRKGWAKTLMDNAVMSARKIEILIGVDEDSDFDAAYVALMAKYERATGHLSNATDAVRPPRDGLSSVTTDTSSSAAGGASPSADASASDNTTTNGLVNLGGTCYVNATVQMILANETVKQAVLRCGNMLSHNAVPQRPNARASSLKWIIFLARTVGTNRLVTETRLDMEGFLRHTRNWGRPWGDRHRHQDAGEFLRTFLEHIEQSVNAVEVEKNIIIGNPMASFQLSLEVTTLCLSSANASTCDSRTHCEQDSLILLPLQPKWLPPDWKRVNVLRSGGDDGFVLYDSMNGTVSRHPTLVEMLDDFFPTDDEDMRTVCDTCRQQLFQSVRFGSQPPESLLLRVKRSWTSAAGGAQKLRNPIGIPDELNIAPSWYADTIDSTTATRYRISSVVVHVGTPQRGHYTTHVADWHGGDACTWTVHDDTRELSGRSSARAATDRLRNAAMVSYTKANAPVAADGGVEEAHELALSPTSIGYRSTLDAVRRVALSRTAKPLHDFIDDVVRNIAGWSGSGTTSQRKAIFATMIKLECDPLHSFVFEHHRSMQLRPTL
jgi:ubiquitin C-terminal hydrolase